MNITIDKQSFYELYAIRDYTNIANYIMFKILETGTGRYKTNKALYDDNVDYSNMPSRDADTSSSGQGHTYIYIITINITTIIHPSRLSR